MKYHTITAVLAAVVAPVLAQVPPYGQCELSDSQILCGQSLMLHPQVEE